MTKKQSKFVFDQLLDREDICNLKDEEQQLKSLIESKSNVVVYGPRNFGKTSLLKSVKSMNSLVGRLQSAFETSFQRSYPVQNFLNMVKTTLKSIQPSFSVDALTGDPSLALNLSANPQQYTISFIFQLIREISEFHPVLVVLDEFQDIVFVDEAQALFREAFQHISELPIVVMGSKRHILSDIFANPKAPIAFWGQDLEIKPIDYTHYHDYIQSRFDSKSIKISLKLATHLQDLLQRVPEPINIICQHILEKYSDTTLEESQLHSAIQEVVELRSSRYANLLVSLTDAEERVVAQVAKSGQILHPTAKDWVSQLNLSVRGVSQIFSRLLDRGIFDLDENGYRLADPLFAIYVTTTL